MKNIDVQLQEFYTQINNMQLKVNMSKKTKQRTVLIGKLLQCNGIGARLESTAHVQLDMWQVLNTRQHTTPMVSRIIEIKCQLFAFLMC